MEDTSTQLRDDPAKTLGLLREAMIAKFGDTPDEALDYAPATLRRPREGALTYEWFGSPMPTASHVVDRVLSKLPCSARLSGRFPRTLHEGVFTEYEKWLEETPMTVAQVGPDPH